jgi:hypothetical protein
MKCQQAIAMTEIFLRLTAVCNLFAVERLHEESRVYTPKQALETLRSKLRGIIPSASRDCSTYQFRCAALSELEFHE